MKAVLGVFLVLLLLVGGWYLTRHEVPAPVPTPPPAAEAPPAPIASTPATSPPEVRFPIERVMPQAPAPGGTPAAEPAAQPAGEGPGPLLTLDNSVELVQRWLTDSVPGDFRGWLATSAFVRRIVATVDNLPREKASVRLWPVSTAKGLPVVDRVGSGMELLPGNAGRYQPYVAMAESVNLDALVAGYKRLYPVFQQAYRDLGYPTGNFNDRLVAVIDHLLAAPEIEGPILLVQPKVVYQFADPELEALSAGQKIMVRIGAGNARRVKARLREIRQMLAGQV